MKRNIRQPVGFEGKELQGYFMISNHDAATALLNKLTGSQIRLWLYLMMIDSFGDFTSNGEKIFHSLPSPAEIAIKIGVTPSTVEKDMRKLKKLGLYDYRITSWQGHNSSAAKAKLESHSLKQKKAESQSGYDKSLFKTSESLNKQNEELNKRTKSLNKTLESLNKQNNELEALPDNGSGSLQTIQTLQTFQTPQTGEGEEKINQQKSNQEEVETNNQKNINQQEIEPTKLEVELEEVKPINQEVELEEVKPTKQEVELEEVKPTKQEVKKVEPTELEVKKVEPTKEVREKDSTDQHLREQIKEQLLSLGISLDKEVMVCIKKHHVSQVQKAIAHIENTWEDIRNPRSVFLYQVPKQTVEKPLKNPLTPEFLEWYSEAISQGLVVDRPAKTLPLNQFREPMVILHDGRQGEWQQVRDGNVQPLLSPSESGEFWTGIRNKLSSLANKNKLEYS